MRYQYLAILHVCNTLEITASNLLEMALVTDSSDVSNSSCSFNLIINNRAVKEIKTHDQLSFVPRKQKM